MHINNDLHFNQNRLRHNSLNGNANIDEIQYIIYIDRNAGETFPRQVSQPHPDSQICVLPTTCRRTVAAHPSLLRRRCGANPYTPIAPPVLPNVVVWPFHPSGDGAA